MESKCGMCLSCYQREACPDFRPSEGNPAGCADYLPPEPTRHEWPQIYRTAIREARKPHRSVQETIQKIGRANAITEALHTIHGYSTEEIRRMEESD